MTLNARVAGLNVVHSRRVNDVVADRVGRMLASRPMAAFAADIPFHNLLGPDVVIHGVAAVAGRAGRPLHVVRRIKRLPPIRPFGDRIRLPGAVGDVPLGWLRIIVIPNPREVTLLPDAPVHQRDLVLGEFGDGIARQIRKNSLRMLARIPHHV